MPVVADMSSSDRKLTKVEDMQEVIIRIRGKTPLLMPAAWPRHIWGRFAKNPHLEEPSNV